MARIDLSKGPGETELGARISQARVNLYLQPTQIDTVNESMQVRISVEPPFTVARNTFKSTRTIFSWFVMTGAP